MSNDNKVFNHMSALGGYENAKRLFKSGMTREDANKALNLNY